MTTVQELRSPEKVLSILVETAEVDGLTAPRRISFDESTPTTPLAVLSLTWLSLADMRPWLPFFAAGKVRTYRRGDGSAHYSAYADFFGWSLSLNAVDSVACTCGGEIVHQVGCDSIDKPIPYVPVPMPTGVQANAAECARLRGGTVHHVPEGVHPRGREPHEPTDHGVPIVDVLTVDPELDVIERDDNAVMGRVLPPQMLFAEAADRLADAMLGEASGE